MNSGTLLLSEIRILVSEVKEKIRNGGSDVALPCFKVAGVG